MDEKQKEWAESVMQPLRDWLVEHRAVCNWCKEIERVGTVSGYVVNGNLFVIMAWKDGGWEAFTAVENQDIKGSLRDLEAACRLLTVDDDLAEEEPCEP